MANLPLWYRVHTFHCPIHILKHEHWLVNRFGIRLFLVDLLKTVLNSEWSGSWPDAL
jgi:hypothetical protein